LRGWAIFFRPVEPLVNSNDTLIQLKVTTGQFF